MDTNVEKPKGQMLKQAMNYGLIFGVILIAFSVLQWALNLSMESFMSYISYAIMIACLYFFARKYRDEHTNGHISYGKAFKFSAFTLLFASFVLAFYTFIFFKFIDPGMIEKILEKSREAMLNRNSELTEEQIDMAVSMQKKFMTPLMMFVGSLIGNYFFGILFSLITSIFVMKKDKSMNDSSTQQPIS